MNKYRVTGAFATVIISADDFTVTDSPRVLAFQRKAVMEGEPEGIEIVAMFQDWAYFCKVDEGPQ